MSDDLPNEFDLIVVGTGLTESIVAAAASRIGKTVLHLDPNDFYGGYWASFNLEAIQSLQSPKQPTTELPENDNINTIQLHDNICRLENIVQKWSQPSTDGAEINLKNKALKEFRKFNIDITPKLLFARGKLVELLISSNISRYAEFRAVDRVATLLLGELKAVPCSRSDVFTTKAVSVVEKRLLMKLLTTCLNSDDSASGEAEFKEYANKTFVSYLKDKRMTADLQHYILYAICMGDECTSCPDGVRATRRFLESLGRYGNTPFLFPMYGCGEIPQCFCRLCAVFGGVYCLKRNVTQVHFADGGGRRKFEAIECGTQRIAGKNIVFGAGTMTGVQLTTAANDGQTVGSGCGRMSRGIFLIDRPMGDAAMNSGGGGVIFTKIPGKGSGNGDGAYVTQLSHYSGTCPKEWYLVHVTCPSNGDTPENDLKDYVDQLLRGYQWTTDVCQIDNTENVGQVVWSMYFTIPACEQCASAAELPFDGVYVACAPFFELDYDRSIDQAKNIFSQMYADEEFLPRAPDPEEIVIGGDEETETTATDLAALDINEAASVSETPSTESTEK